MLSQSCSEPCRISPSLGCHLVNPRTRMEKRHSTSKHQTEKPSWQQCKRRQDDGRSWIKVYSSGQDLPDPSKAHGLWRLTDAQVRRVQVLRRTPCSPSVSRSQAAGRGRTFASRALQSPPGAGVRVTLHLRALLATACIAEPTPSARRQKPGAKEHQTALAHPPYPGTEAVAPWSRSGNDFGSQARRVSCTKNPLASRGLGLLYPHPEMCFSFSFFKSHL